jgi:hypothetical protein
MSKYEAECVNAREAINRIAANEEKERRAELEAQSERKRQSLRRTQQAAAEARRRAAEARRQREEAEYLGVFDESAAGGLPEGAMPADSDASPGSEQQIQESGDNEPSTADTSQPDGEVAQDLEAIREELRRRQESK